MASQPLTRWTKQQIEKSVEDEVWYEGMLEAVGEGELVGWCKKKRYVYSAVLRWILEDEGRRGDFEAVEKARAARMVEECLTISDGSGDVDTDNLRLMRDKLRIDTWMKVAKSLDRKYGEQGAGVQGVGNVTVILTDYRDRPMLAEDLGPG